MGGDFGVDCYTATAQRVAMPRKLKMELKARREQVSSWHSVQGQSKPCGQRLVKSISPTPLS